MGAVEELHERFRDQVAFYVVYIKEAHPEDGWVVNSNRASNITVFEPKDDIEREAVASACSLRMQIRIPMLLDGMDNRVASAYGGWPDRLYLIDRDGRIAYQSGPGPQGFRPEELESAIKLELAT